MWQLEYMDFDSLDELAKKYIGDYQLLQPPHNPYNYSTNVYWDNYDKMNVVELYGFRNGGTSATVTIHGDGSEYYWPQNAQTVSENDYFLIKHIDSIGNATLQYKQLKV